MTRSHLHLDDYPATLGLLAALRNGRPAEDWARIGYEPTEHGAWVDWDQLTGSWLSNTELAVVRIAHGCATLERTGGPPPQLTEPVRNAIAAVTPTFTPPPWLPRDAYK